MRWADAPAAFAGRRFPAALGGVCLKPSILKTFRRTADNPYVRRSSVITGVLLAFSAASLAGVGYWVSGGFDSLYEAASASGYDARSGVPQTAERELASARVPSYPGSRPGGVASPGSSEYTIRKTVPEVRLQFTVADQQGRLVSDLRSDDIRIFDDQAPVSRLQQFEKMSDLPLRIGLLLDASDSMKRVVTQEKSVALAFLRQVLRPQTDRAFVMAFGSEIKVMQDPTGDPGNLMEAVNHAHGPGDATNFYDALYSACANQWQPEDALVHRVIVVITDGEDTGSRHGLQDAIAAAQRGEVQVYALTVHAKRRSYPGDPILQKVADETGGRFFIANTDKEVGSIFDQVQQEMRTQYYVSFRPLRQTPGFHALDVQVQSPQKLQVHARRGYFAIYQ